MESKRTVQSAERIISIYELLVRQGEMGVTEIAKALSMNKTTVFRLLSTLVATGYVKQSEANGKYRSTLKLLSIAESLRRQMDIVGLAHPHLQSLCEQTGETVHLVQREGNQIVCIDKVEPSSNSMRMGSRIGHRMSMYSTAVGKTIMAQLPQDEVDRLWNSMSVVPLTPNTITDYGSFLEALRHCRQNGYALDREENEMGVYCVASCIVNYKNEANNAFSVSGPSTRLTEDHIKNVIVPLVLQTKELLSKEFGH